MTDIGIYPGSFDPVTRGHEDLIWRSLHFVDTLVVAVARNSGKAPLFSTAERIELVKAVTAGDERIEVMAFEGLLVDFARETRAKLIVRGLRAVADFEYEFQMALMNRMLFPDVETVFLVPAQDLTFLSSSLVREVAGLGGDVSELVHPTVNEALLAKLGG